MGWWYGLAFIASRLGQGFMKSEAADKLGKKLNESSTAHKVKRIILIILAVALFVQIVSMLTRY